MRAVKDGDTNNHKFIKYSIALVEKEGKEIQTLSLACVGGKYEISKNLLIYYCLYFQFNLREMIFSSSTSYSATRFSAAVQRGEGGELEKLFKFSDNA